MRLTFSGFRDGGADDISDGQTIFRLRDENGKFVTWFTTGGTGVEVSAILVQHDPIVVSAEMVFNDDDSLFVEISLGVLVGIAPSEIGAFLLEQNWAGGDFE